jgi:hypothetical protein
MSTACPGVMAVRPAPVRRKAQWPGVGAACPITEEGTTAAWVIADSYGSCSSFLMDSILLFFVIMIIMIIIVVLSHTTHSITSLLLISICLASSSSNFSSLSLDEDVWRRGVRPKGPTVVRGHRLSWRDGGAACPGAEEGAVARCRRGLPRRGGGHSGPTRRRH